MKCFDAYTPIPQAVYERRDLRTIAARWDARARDWDKALADPECHLNAEDAYQEFLRHADAVIAERQAFCRRQGVIDAGCGTGEVLAKVVGRFAWGMGVDISGQMIQVAEAKRIQNARFVVGDCFRLGELAPKAGAVLSRGVLLSHYGPRQGLQLLCAARAAVVESGFILFDFLNEAARGLLAHVPEHKTHFRASEISRLAKRAGFRKAVVPGGETQRVLLLFAEA